MYGRLTSVSSFLKDLIVLHDNFKETPVIRDSVMQDTIFLKKMKLTSTARTFYANLFNFNLERLVIFLPWMCRSFILSQDSFS